MVMVSVSNCQPKTIFLVAQVVSPFSIFLRDAGSWRWGMSLGSSRRSTYSNKCRRTRFT
jgi:hypothetical protein